MESGHDRGVPVFLAGIEQFRVLHPVFPGDTVTSRVALTKELGSVAQFEVECAVGDKPVGRGRLLMSRQIRSPRGGE